MSSTQPSTSGTTSSDLGIPAEDTSIEARIAAYWAQQQAHAAQFSESQWMLGHLMQVPVLLWDVLPFTLISPLVMDMVHKYYKGMRFRCVKPTTLPYPTLPTHAHPYPHPHPQLLTWCH